MADGSRHSIYMVAESTYGTTPASPAMDTLRITGTTLALTKSTFQSGELREDRQIENLRHGTKQVGGEISAELSYGTWDDVLEALLGGTWGSGSDTGSIPMDAADGSFTRTDTGGDFTADGFVAGDYINVTGFVDAGNNGKFKVDSLTATVLTVTPLEGQTMAAETGGGDERAVAEDAVRAGTTRRSFTVERHFADLDSGNKFRQYTGVEFNTLDLSISADAVVTATFGVVGQDEASASATVAGSTNAATTSAPLDSFSGNLKEGGAAIAVVTELSLNLDNGLEARHVVGKDTTERPSIGRSNLTGTMTVYFEDAALLDKFTNETESSLELTLTDGTNTYTVKLPRIKYTGGQPDVEGEGPITLSMPFQALRDSTEQSNIVIAR